MKINKLRYRSPSTTLMMAILQIVGGGSLSIVFTVFYVILRAVGSIGSSLIFLQALLLAIVLLARGIWNCSIYGRYRRFSRAVINKSAATTVKQLAESMNRSTADVFSDIHHTVNGRFWSGYGLTDNTFVLADANKNSGTILAGPDMVFTEARRRSRGCIVWFAVVWVLFLINPGLTVWYQYIAATVLSLAALLLGSAILPKKIIIGQKAVKVEEYKPEPVKTGVEETDDLLTEGLKHFGDLVELDKTINDPKLDKPVRELLDVTRQIFDYVKKQPEKSKQIRQFVKYYLPTTIKLLKNYDELNRQPVKGENILESIKKIEGIMDGILITFRQQLDDLYREKNIDIAADIAVMENMINQDDVLSGKSEPTI